MQDDTPPQIAILAYHGLTRGANNYKQPRNPRLESEFEMGRLNRVQKVAGYGPPSLGVHRNRGLLANPLAPTNDLSYRTIR